MTTKSRKPFPQGATPRRFRPAPEPPAPEGPAAQRFREDGGWQRRWLQQRLALREAWSRLFSAPVATLMTLSVLGVALAFPAGLYAVIDNVRTLTRGWNSSAQISVFLRKNLPATQTDQILAHLRQRPEVAQAQFVSSQQAWDEFRAASGLGDALDVLEENPLPAVILVQPRLQEADPGKLDRLLAYVQAEPGVESAQFDTAWVQKLYALLDLARQMAWWLTGLAAAAVLLIVGNTIRLMSHGYREQIEVYKLLGATNAYVRRPFLYAGAIYGLAGGVLAWGIVMVSFISLGKTVEQVATLYGSHFLLAGPDILASLVLLVGGPSLGWVGSWLAVERYLRAIQPT